MPAVWLWFRAELRRRWRSWAALTLIVGVAGGVVIGTIAGARRTDTAYRRFLEASNPVDVVVQGVPFPLDVEAISDLPEVEHAFNTPYVFLAPAPGEDALPLAPVVGPDHRSERYDRSKVLAGRRANPDSPDEATVSAVATRTGGIDVGDALHFVGYSPEGAAAILQGDRRPPDGPRVSVRIVGVELPPGSLLPSEEEEGTLLLTPAFARLYESRIGTTDLLRVKLHRGRADLAAFKAGVERISGDRPPSFNNMGEDTVQVQRSIHLQAVALRLFALLAGVAALLILGQALAREAFVEAGDQATLATLGLTGPQRWLASILRPITVAAVGSALAVFTAVLSSPILPFGLAQDAEPDPGLAFDPLMVLGGAAVLTAVLVGVVAWPTWRGTRVFTQVRRSTSARTSRVTESLARAGLRPTVITGVRMAVEPGSGRSAVSTRAALVGSAMSVVALVAAFTFGSSLQRLLNTPRLYGWDWDVLVGDYFLEDLSDQVEPVLAAAPEVAGYSAITVAEADVGGVRTPTFGFDAVRGAVFPPIVSGREPRRSDEMVLGAKTLRAVDRGVGDRVSVQVGDRHAEFRIVGTGVLPSLGGGEIAGLGEGALLTGDGLARVVPDAPRSLYAVRYEAGLTDDAVSATIEPLEESVGVADSSLPTRVADFGRVDRMPVVLAGLLAMIAVVTLVHLLGSGVRRRRRDMAILKTLGFARRQVGATVAWQATTLALFALAVGIPLGIVAGRWSWGAFADELGIVREPVVPLVAVLLIVPIALTVANMVAAVPARAAAHTRPALVLRSE